MAMSMFEIDNRASDWRKLQEGSDFATRINHAPSFAQQVKDFAVQAGFETADLEGDKYSVAFHELEEVGYSQPMHLMDRGEASEIVSYFKARPCYNAHVPNQSDGVGRRVGEDANRHPFGSYSLGDVIAAPRLLELANELDIPLLDMLPVLRNEWHENQRSLFFDHCHHTPEGSKIIAEDIYRFLASRH